MRKLIEVALLVAATIAMFAFPVLVLGLAPWLGDSLIGMVHLSLTHGLVSAIEAIVMLFSSSAGLLLLAVPVFGAVLWGLSRALGSNSAKAHQRDAAQPVSSRPVTEAPDAGKAPASRDSRPRSMLREQGKASGTAEPEARSGPSLPALRSRRISTVRRSADEQAPLRTR